MNWSWSSGSSHFFFQPRGPNSEGERSTLDFFLLSFCEELPEHASSNLAEPSAGLLLELIALLFATGRTIEWLVISADSRGLAIHGEEKGALNFGSSCFGLFWPYFGTLRCTMIGHLLSYSVEQVSAQMNCGRILLKAERSVFWWCFFDQDCITIF